MTEQWVLINGIDSSYSVSDLGRVRNNETGCVLSENRRNKQGYVLYGLMSDGKMRDFYGHRLVANAFLGASHLPVVRHLDDVKNNNRLENLAYGTFSDNRKDAVRNGALVGRQRSTHCTKGHEMTPENQRWDKGRDYPLCRTCRNALAKASKARVKARAA